MANLASVWGTPGTTYISAVQWSNHKNTSTDRKQLRSMAQYHAKSADNSTHKGS